MYSKAFLFFVKTMCTSGVAPASIMNELVCFIKDVRTDG